MRNRKNQKLEEKSLIGINEFYRVFDFVIEQYNMNASNVDDDVDFPQEIFDTFEVLTFCNNVRNIY